MAIVYFLVTLFSLIALGLFAAVPGPTDFMVVALLIGAGCSCLFALALELRRPRPLVGETGDTVRGIYLPKNGLAVAGSEGLQGKLLIWTAAFRFDAGPNKGEWAMEARDDGPSILVPLSDLVIQERRKALLFKAW